MIHKIIIFFYVIMLCSLSTFAQESKVKINQEGKDITSLKHAWSAQWITHPTASTLDGIKCRYRCTRMFGQWISGRVISNETVFKEGTLNARYSKAE